MKVKVTPAYMETFLAEIKNAYINLKECEQRYDDLRMKLEEMHDRGEIAFDSYSHNKCKITRVVINRKEFDKDVEAKIKAIRKEEISNGRYNIKTTHSWRTTIL